MYKASPVRDSLVDDLMGVGVFFISGAGAGYKKLKIKLFKVCTIPSGHNFNFSVDPKPGAGGGPHQIIYE